MKHFDTLKNWIFNTSVKKVSRNADDTKWCLEVETASDTPTIAKHEFDKVVFCHGYQTRAKIPTFGGQEKFEGTVMHSQQYRRLVLLHGGLVTGCCLADLVESAN